MPRKIQMETLFRYANLLACTSPTSFDHLTSRYCAGSSFTPCSAVAKHAVRSMPLWKETRCRFLTLH